mmetsp:Transcript_42581/g.101499  ORF Transcript_42581/g.101499 Transcript_42581/m.101499 type:complete len:246 (-) Transcript_42581:617-1354(-)
MDGAQVLLVGFPVGLILVQHVRRASLHLRLQDSEPERLRLDGLPALALRFQPGVHLLKVLAPDVHQALAGLLIKGLVGAEQSPVLIVLDPLHEEIRHPQAEEEIPSALLLLAVVLPQLQKVEDVSVPRLQVHGKGALALAPTLVHVSGSFVEVPQHWHQPVAFAVGAPDVGAGGADVGDGHTDASRRFGDLGTLLQCVVDALDAVVLHLQQEARRHLGPGSAGVEERGRRVREEILRHHVVGLQG